MIFTTNNSSAIVIFDYSLSRAGVTNFFCKGSDNIYFRLCRPHGFSCNYSTLPSSWENSHRQGVSKRVWLCSDKTIFTKTGNGPDLAKVHNFPTPVWWYGLSMRVLEKRCKLPKTFAWWNSWLVKLGEVIWSSYKTQRASICWVAFKWYNRVLLSSSE